MPTMNLDSADMLRVIREYTRSVEQEFTDLPLAVDGTLPPALDGVLFRNGPGRFERGGHRYAHPFDGDGHVLRLALGPGGVRYTNRFVRTREFVREERAGRMLYRSFGTNLPGGVPANLLRLAFKNAANTNVIWHGGRLLALWEAAAPYRLDPHTLATLGPEDFDGQLRNQGSWLSRRLAPLLPFSAHPRIDSATGDLYSFGLVSGRNPELLLYRVDRGGRMDPWQAHPLPRYTFVHDFAVTRRWICALLPQAEFGLGRAALGLTTAVGSLRLDTERPMQALLLPRAGDHPPAHIDCATGFVFHIAQAFDRDDGALVLDVIRYSRYPELDRFEALFEAADGTALPRLERLVIDPARGRSSITPWGGCGFELPTAAPRPLGDAARVLYGIGAPEGRQAPYLSAIQRLDTETGALTSRDFGLDLVGEPVPVADPAGDEGWLLCLRHRAGRQRTELMVLRAADLATVATAALPHAVPVGFHGCWVPRAALE